MAAHVALRHTMCIHTVTITHKSHTFISFNSSNPEENELVMMILEQLMEQGVGQSQIGIITPYRGQEKLIKSSLAKRYVSLA